ncbi:MAG: sensor histidine kinase [Anaerolineaceae bacterium]|nr:sensor histidine kinase [Anaerolineaceae bacterium]
MTKEIVDRRVLRILRWSIFVQVLFLLQSSFSPRFYFMEHGIKPEVEFITIAPILVMALILFFLSFREIQSRITKPIFFIILNVLALTTIYSRKIISTASINNLRSLVPLLTFRWDIIFFLIVPLVFIAWQYSMREVIFYCIMIVLVEAVPLFFPNESRGLIFVIANVFGDIARSVILAIVGWIENQLVTLQRAQHAQLIEANKQLRKYALTNEKLAQTQERNRLARELHDTLAHTLSSVSVQLEATKALFDRDPAQAKKMLGQTIKNTKNGLTETRRTLIDLRSSELESYGLTQAIRNIGKSTAERGGFKIGFHLDKSMDILSDDIGHCLYRTTQESLENILRHANAKNVSINLIFDGDAIKLQVIDDGNGFDVHAVKKEHLGIRGMRERVEMLGGTFIVNSDLKNGTNITVVLERKND